ncbi:MAG TPA: hypothetical protein DCR24_07475 [Bacillus bacterium]|nr:hypothetical protein [Bacillus sp. (in: firmicutes)]
MLLLIAPIYSIGKENVGIIAFFVVIIDKNVVNSACFVVIMRKNVVITSKSVAITNHSSLYLRNLLFIRLPYQLFYL